MANIIVPSQQWVKVFNEDEYGRFRILNFRAKTKRSASLPVGSDGLTEDVTSTKASDIITFIPDPDEPLSLYVFNLESGGEGIVEIDK